MAIIKFTYQISLKRGETKKYELPNLKSSGLMLQNFTVIFKGEHRAIRTYDIKIIGKETIVSYGEAVLYQTQTCDSSEQITFDLAEQVTQIVESDGLTMMIKNLSTVKDVVNSCLEIVLCYKKTQGTVIFNNVYTNLNPDGMFGILEDIRKAGKHITKVIFTSSSKLSTFELTPQFSAEPVWLKPITILADQKNQIVIDLSDEKYDAEFINNLKYYILTPPSTNVEKLGLIVYGYSH